MRMRGDLENAVPVEVIIDDEHRLRIVAGSELIGEWPQDQLGVHALNDGFAIRAEGEEFVLNTNDDVAVAESLGLATASPRLARRVAASHRPPEPEAEPEVPRRRSQIAAITFALGGVLVLTGGFVMQSDPTVGMAAEGPPGFDGTGEFWVAFVIGGLFMVAAGYVLTLGRTWGRILSIVVLLVLVGLFILAAQNSTFDADQLLAYGFVAGGLVVGVAVIFSGSIATGD